MTEQDIFIGIGVILLLLFLLFYKKENEYDKDPREFIISKIKNKTFRNTKSEKEYNQKLKNFFQEEFKKIEKDTQLVKSEYPIDGGYKLDLIIDDKFVLELKYKLTTRKQVDSSYTSITKYIDEIQKHKKFKTKDIFLVICGDVKKEMKTDLIERLNKYKKISGWDPKTQILYIK